MVRFARLLVANRAVAGLLATSLLVAMGCSGHPPYPRAWPSLSTSSKQSCARVAGRYKNVGERGQMEIYGPITIIELLFGQIWWRDAETVSVSFPQADRLDIDFTAVGEPISRSLSRKSGEFSCKGGTLVLQQPSKWMRGFAPTPAGPTPFVGGESQTLKLDLVEGYLIVTKRDNEFMWLPIPMRTTWSSWYRFQRLVP